MTGTKVARGTAIDDTAAALITHCGRGGAFQHYWTDAGLRSHWFPVGETPEIPAAFLRANCYFSVNPATEIPPTNSRGEPKPPHEVRVQKKYVAAVNVLFAEFDAKDWAGGKDAIMAHLDTFAGHRLPYPSVIVDSGGGYHCYWFLANTLPVTDANREHVAAVQAAWVGVVGADDVKDLARVLRVPGTLNRKTDYGPDFPTVKIVHADWVSAFDFALFESITGLDEAGRSADEARQKVSPSRTNKDPVYAAFNAANSIQSMLEGDGYTLCFKRPGTTRMARPGRDKGQPSVTIFTGSEPERSYHHSSNDPLHSPDFARDAFDVFTQLEHGGDASEAYRAAKKALGLWQNPSVNGASPPEPRSADPENEPPQPPAWMEAAPGDYLRSDLGNAQRLIDYHGENFFYVEGLGWFVWDGKRWKPDPEGLLVARMAYKAATAVYKQAWKDQDKSLSKWAITIANRTRIAGAMEAAKSDARVLRLVTDIDTNPWALNCENGTVDLRTGKLGPHNRTDLITKLIPIPYDPDAPCPVWLKHLQAVHLGDAEMIERFRVFNGMALCGDVSQEMWAFCSGRGDNGKTVTLKTIQKVMGEYAIALSAESLMADKFNPGYELADLRGARAVFAFELPDGKFNSARIKRLASNEEISARQIREKQRRFEPTHTLFVAGNPRPTVDDTSDGFWRRMGLFPFDHKFEGKEKDIHFSKKLEAELPGILAWQVSGCVTWVKDGLPKAAKADLATNEYRQESNPTARFIDEECIFNAGAKIAVKRLYEAYKAWCEREGETPDSNRSFGKQFSNLRPETNTEPINGERIRNGIMLRAQETPGHE